MSVPLDRADGWRTPMDEVRWMVVWAGPEPGVSNPGYSAEWGDLTPRWQKGAVELRGRECLGHIRRGGQDAFLVVESTGWDRRLCVVADGKRLVGHAGAVLLRRCADRTGLTGVLAGVPPSSTATGWRERAGCVRHCGI